MASTTAGSFAEPKQSAGTLAIGSWMLFDWAAQPFYTLITTFLFAPFFTTVFIGDAARGSALWGYTMAVAAILVAVGSPVLGAMADARGRIKPMIVWLSIGFILGQVTLWYAIPGETGFLWLILPALVLATIAGEYSIVLTNALMPRLVGTDQLGSVSGGGWALGYAGGLISLVIMAAFILIDTQSGLTMFGLEPLISFDTASREADRFVGPFCALWFAAFAIPFFLFTPDAPRKQDAGRGSIGAAFSTLGKTLRNIRSYRNIVLFFIARMLYIDGLLAIFTFGGIYAASVFGWQTIVIGYFGIILSVAAGIGAAIGGFLDDKLGSKAVIVGALLLLIVGALGVISIDKNHIFFFLEVSPSVEGDIPFKSAGEQFYLAFAILIGLASGPLQSASRSLLARMAPEENMTEFFGFFAFSGKVTAFAAPFLIALIADMTGSLQTAMSMILVFLTVGLAVMSSVRTARA